MKTAEIKEKTVLAMKIQGAEVIFEDYGEGKGKLTINNWTFKGSAYWGSMGDSLFDFLLRINEDYFVSNLGSTDRGQIDKRKSFANFRRQLAIDLPWYQEMEWQKETLRPELKRKQEYEIDGERSFVDVMSRFGNDLYYYDIKDRFEREEIESTVKAVCDECWNYLEYREHNDVRYLKKLFKEIKKSIKKYQKNEKRNI
jgi:hypothetical protein